MDIRLNRENVFFSVNGPDGCQAKRDQVDVRLNRTKCLLM